MFESSEDDIWTAAEVQIQGLLNHSSNVLNDKSREAVQHYLDVGEYEMAFEGLFIELMSLKFPLSKEESRASVLLGGKLGLNNESVFDENFWQKLSDYCKNAD